MKGLKHETISPAHGDERRTLTPMFNGDFTANQIKILKIKKGSTLGNHYHLYHETFYLLEGEAEYTFEDIKTKERQKIDLKKSQRVTIAPRIAHKAVFTEDTIMIEGTEDPYVSKEVNDKEYIINDNIKMITSLITGIGGFVASHLADLILGKGEKVVGTYRWTEDLSRIEHIKDRITMASMDLNDLYSCIKTLEEHKPDYVFHLAAQSYPSDSFIYPKITIETNTIGTYNLLEAVRIVRENEKIKGEVFDPVVHVCSSSEVYGLVTEDLVPIKETCRFNPANPYAVGKVGTDMLGLMYWTNYKVKTIRTRMFTHTGPRRSMMSAENSFAKQIALIEKGKQEPLLKHGNLNSIRTWADVRDAVRAYYLLVRKCKPGEVYNIGGTTTKTIGEMLKYLLSLTNKEIKTEQDLKLLRPYDVTLQIPDCSKFINETGWKPEYSFEQTMQDLLDWWRERV